GLNNRKRNLRVCTAAENNHNTRGHRGKSSRWKGVNFFTPKKRFRAQIRYKDREYFLGYFRDEAQAGRAYDKKAKELFGDFAYLNFPEEHG
ncbi:MAG: endonuclease, partial [Planctomycetes bacterium]|nr:endonuclease [Planctomycetota bacterium]